MNMITIGIAGGTGSGKTTFTKRIKECFEDVSSIVYHDNYYKRHDDMPFEDRERLNYDHPDAFDTTLMIEHIKQLQNGETIECPTYDYTLHNRAEPTITVVPKQILIVEGILIFQNPDLVDLMDMKIFVDTDADVRILRRLKRDVKKRGRTVESVIEQYLTTVKPMHDAFVEPSKRVADIIVPEGGKNPVALEMVAQKLYSHLKQCEE